mmetsp:Transcript_351/g.514  ORF Transcript_351/g.514 Transcript_351/m.514 type:complete len:82 (+) Transcript_351:730-975(+)
MLLLNNSSEAQKTVQNVCDGVREYFDLALENCLLYAFEKEQNDTLKEEHKGKLPSEVYGAEHLLRLFGKSSIHFFCYPSYV